MSEPPIHVTAEGVHPEPRHTGHRLFDLVIALSAITISVISLFVAIEHSHVERQLVAANSWPFLEIEDSNATVTGEKRVSIALINEGVGPAKLETLELFYDGKPVATAKSFMTQCCGIDPHTVGLQINDAGVIRAGRAIELLVLARTDQNDLYWQRLNRARSHLTYRGCYCSVLDECWINDLQSLKPTPVKICPKPAVPYEGHDFRPSA